MDTIIKAIHNNQKQNRQCELKLIKSNAKRKKRNQEIEKQFETQDDDQDAN